MKKLLHEAVLERRLVCDGAMGTQLMLAGLEPGACGELWNITNRERVLEIQRRYMQAGADCLITNTFGASRTRLGLHGQADNVYAINHAGVLIAREAFGDIDGYVLGDIGPLGAILEPYGDLSLETARTAYEEQARVLVEAGVDAIIIETQTSLEELSIAVEAAQKAGAPCIIASLSYDLSAGKTFCATMMGVLPDEAARQMQMKGADIIGLNCGTGLDMSGAATVIEHYRKACTLPIMVQPNAGLPSLEHGKAVYKQLPEDMSRGVPLVLQAGANIVGSCCGSTPEHTLAIRERVNEFNLRKTNILL